MLINTIGINYIELVSGRRAFEHDNYEEVYELFAGRKLKEGDEIRYQRAKAALAMESKVTAY